MTDVNPCRRCGAGQTQLNESHGLYSLQHQCAVSVGGTLVHGTVITATSREQVVDAWNRDHPVPGLTARTASNGETTGRG